ncbi:hypothetical protein ACEPAG_6776 [Sanghuangporus baumii]
MAQNPSQGIHKLPGETILDIMEQTVSTYHDAVSLALVCSRFKSIAASPTVWANCKLSMNLSQGQISAIVRRSRGLPLRASIIIDEDHEGWTGLPSDAEKVLRYSELFEDLYIFLPLHFDEQWRSLHVNYPMPRLLHLQTTFMPRPIAGNKITQCSVVLNDDEPYPTMLEFLASVPLLHTLNIHIVSLYHRHLDLDSLRQTVTFCRLKRMEVIGSYCQLLVNVFDNLVLDSLADLIIVFSWASNLSASQAATVVRAACRYQSLERLLVKVEGRFGTDASKSFSEDTTIDSFESALLSNVSNGLKELQLIVPPRRSATRWSYRQGSYSSPESVDVAITCGKDLSTDAFLEIIKSTELAKLIPMLMF